uniref:Peptidylprolyl isomerase n=1 Tax=Cairina moschata TaxID=8855 RepID=A0A8C3C4L5_CAIMO
MAAVLRAVLLAVLLGAAVLRCAAAALIPPAEVEVEVLQKPFLCRRRSKWGDLLLVHYEGFLQSDGAMFHST